MQSNPALKKSSAGTASGNKKEPLPVLFYCRDPLINYLCLLKTARGVCIMLSIDV